MFQKQLLKFIQVLFFLLSTYFILFNHLDREVFRLYDETRVVMNTYEMIKNGNGLVLHFGGQPDMWNTKPPLLHWIQLGFVKTLGFGELSMRLPSAIAAFLTCMLLIYFSFKRAQSYWLGMFTVLVLISSQGFVGTHMARHCEYDSLLTFFTTLYSLAFFLYLEEKDKNDRLKYLNWTFVGLTLAVLTKGIAGLLLTPGMILFMILKKQLIPSLNMWQSYRNLFLFFGVVIGYYLLRDYYNPGYIEAVIENELGGRYKEVGVNHYRGYYRDFFFNKSFSHWYSLLFVGFIIGGLWKNHIFQPLVIYIGLTCGLFFLILGESQTKFYWYMMPMFPLLSIVVAICLYFIYENIKQLNVLALRPLQLSFLSLTVVISILIVPYFNTLHDEAQSSILKDDPIYDVSYYLRDELESRLDVDSFYLCQTKYTPHSLIYVKLLEEEKKNIFLAKYQNLTKEKNVIAYQKEVIDYIEENYNYELIDSFRSVQIYNIIGND